MAELDPLSKSHAGRRLSQGLPHLPAVEAASPRLQVRSLSGFAAALLRSGLDQALANARELAAGVGGDAHVHQLRVGLRRLRIVLRELGGVGELASLREQVEPVLRELFRVLGQHRDRATLPPALEREILAAGGPAITWQAPLPDVAAAVRTPSVQSAWLLLLAAAHRLEQVPDAEAVPLKSARRLVRKRLAKLHARLLENGRNFDEAAVAGFVAELKGVQDALGRYQDEVAARELFRERAAEDPAAWFAVGWFSGRSPSLARRCGKACRRVAKAKVFWT